MRRMTTFALVLGSLLVGTAGTAGTAAAAPPIVIKPGPGDATFPLPAGAVCAFDALFEATGKGGQVIFSDGRVLTISPGLKITITNLATGVAWPTVATGAFHDAPGEVLENGDFRFRSHMTGHNLLFGLFDDGGGPQPGMRKYVGLVDMTVTFTPGGPVFSEIDAHAAQVTDVCAALA